MVSSVGRFRMNPKWLSSSKLGITSSTVLAYGPCISGVATNSRGPSAALAAGIVARAKRNAASGRNMRFTSLLLSEFLVASHPALKQRLAKYVPIASESYAASPSLLHDRRAPDWRHQAS